MRGVDDWPVHLRHLVMLHGPNVVWNVCLESLGYPAWMCHTNAEATAVAEAIKRQKGNHQLTSNRLSFLSFELEY